MAKKNLRRRWPLGGFDFNSESDYLETQPVPPDPQARARAAARAERAAFAAAIADMMAGIDRVI